MFTLNLLIVTLHEHCLSGCHTNKLSAVDCREMIAVQWSKSVDAADSGNPIVPASDQTGY